MGLFLSKQYIEYTNKNVIATNTIVADVPVDDISDEDTSDIIGVPSVSQEVSGKPRAKRQ